MFLNTVEIMTSSIVPFSQELAQQFLESAEGFPVDFDLAWVWMGYSTKQKCLKKLQANFDEDIDFNINQTVKVQNEGGRQVSRPYDQVNLSVDCFKQLGMMAGTEKGKSIRKYFIECEREAKAALAPKTGADLIVEMALMFKAQETRLLLLEAEQKEFALQAQRLQLEQQQIQAEQSQMHESLLQHDAEIGRIFEPDGMLITLAGCLNLHGKHATASQLASVGRAASKLYRERYCKEPEKVGDARYGQVGAYPQAIAESALRDHGYLT